MGPVISRESKTRIEGLIARGKSEGASVVLDGRGTKVPNHGQGNFIKPTVLENVPPGGELSKTEIFGPVLSLVHAETVDEALDLLSQSLYGNAASIFTSSGAAARKFRYEVQAGNFGVNIYGRTYGLLPFLRLEGQLSRSYA